MEAHSHEGPLPSVEMFAGYEKVCSGAARDILDMAKTAQSHQNYMQRYAASSEFWLPVIGIVGGRFQRLEHVCCRHLSGVYRSRAFSDRCLKRGEHFNGGRRVFATRQGGNTASAASSTPPRKQRGRNSRNK